MSGEAAGFAASALEEFATRLFIAAGMSDADARLVADSLVWAELRGHAGHGLSRIPLYLDLIDKGFLAPAARPRLALDRPSLFVVEADRAAGAVAMDFAAGLAGDRARSAGLAFGIVRNASHTGAIGRYAERLAQKGLAAIIAAAGPPLMAYQGAAVPSVSTSPLALAVPGPGAPVVLDMATSVVALGRIMQARRLGKPIPADWALTADGVPTTDPAKADVLLPMGGAKGAGLSLMFELFTGLLAANPILAGAVASGESRAAARNGLQNAFIFALDIEAFRPLGDFTADVGELEQALKALPRRDGVEAILMPGERGAAEAARRASDGIILPPPQIEALKAAGARLGIPFPEPAIRPAS